MNHPPIAARTLAAWLLRGDAREVVAGDLDEAFVRRIRDVLTIGLAAGLLTRVAIAAGSLPARRAARMDPLVPLRVE